MSDEDKKIRNLLARNCGIPAKTLPPCDLEWGHAGDQHANSSDGFYARDYDAEHRARQQLRAAAFQADGVGAARARNDVVRAAMAFDEGGDSGALTAACARLRLIEQHDENAGWVPRLCQFVRSRYTGHRYCIEDLAPDDPDGRTVKLNNGSWLRPDELMPEKEI